MDFNKDTILQEVLKHNRVAERVNELKLSKEQMYDALPILIDMADEKEDGKIQTLTSFEVNSEGVVKRIAILSEAGKKKTYLENILTQKINNINFDTDMEFFKDEGRKEVVNTFSRYIKEPGVHNKGLYIYGDMGIGKTFIMKTFAKLLAEKGRKVGFVYLSNLVSYVKSSFGKTTLYEDTLNMLKEVDYLFIDDIGAEMITSWFRDEFLFSLLNERMDKERVTFFSSNYSTDALANHEAKTNGTKYKDYDKANRLVTRVKSLTHEILVTGKNRRY